MGQPDAARSAGREIFPVYLIKPSHYDDDGYVIQWFRSAIPSNSLASMYGILRDCVERGVLGDDVDVEIRAHDETNTRIVPQRIIRAIRARGGRGLVALVGVQSNQFPRAMDLARPLREAGIPVCIGGFHASGSLAMLPEPPPEIRAAWDLGVSIFSGEAEGRLDAVLRDAHRGELAPLYDHLSDLPGLGGSPIPILPHEIIARHPERMTSFDAGRGCPFQCSFCTIINVQGRKSRHRSADDVEAILRANHAQGIRNFFITDDNFARNRNWEAIFDRMIDLRQKEGLRSRVVIQVDTLCHRIPGFIKKARLAGVKRVFIGLENINPENLAAASKKQNRIAEYRTMLQAWKRAGVITYCGYIIGFPSDTKERVLRDIETLKRELPVDLLEFFHLTPLPGSADHKHLAAEGAWMEPDLNKYDLECVCAKHPRMSDAELRETYAEAWERFYSLEHVETLMRRAAAYGRRSRRRKRREDPDGIRTRQVMRFALWFYFSHAVERVHPLQGGKLRRKYRRDRRPGMPPESAWVFYPRYALETASKVARLGALYWRFRNVRARVESDPRKDEYTDVAITPAAEDDVEVLSLFEGVRAARPAAQGSQRAGVRPRIAASRASAPTPTPPR